MSNSGRPDGGPAFPRTLMDATHPDNDCIAFSGMSLREWYAGQALAAVVSFPDHLVGHMPEYWDRWAWEQADIAVRLADAMISRLAGQVVPQPR